MFITLEGPEGSGKTTAVEAAVKELQKLGYDVVRTREPGGTPIAEQIRNVILDSLVNLTVNIDYPDEDIEVIVYEKMLNSLKLINRNRLK